MTGFTVRPARPDDLDLLMALRAEVAAEGRWIGAELPLDEEGDRATLRQGIDASSAFVATDDEGRIVGHLGMSLPRYKVADLGMLVAADWRGRGVGSALLDRGIEWARAEGAHKIALQHWPHNEGAHALYEKFGFRQEGYLRRQYPRKNGEIWDAVVMGLVLDEADSVDADADADADEAGPVEPYYRSDLALVHHRGFGFHADACAPGLLALLEPVREQGGTVLEVGCGSGLLTRHLTDAGLSVIATDASAAMLDLARRSAPEADVGPLVLPDDPVPAADAVVGVGHVLNYLPDEGAVRSALTALAQCLRSGGLLALDLCDLAYADARRDAPPYTRVEDDWAIHTRFSLPSPARFVREITTFVRRPDGAWDRDDERHDNVLVDASAMAEVLGGAGVATEVRPAFGSEELPDGIVALIGHRPA